MTDWLDILDRIQASPLYQAGILYGEPRPGHEEGTVAAHISELKRNLFALSNTINIPAERQRKLLILIHVHDTFKGVASPRAAIADPNSHASLAAAFLAEYTADVDLLRIVQHHDLGFALYRKHRSTGRTDLTRLHLALDPLNDLDLFLQFCILDACTGSKERDSIRWWLALVTKEYPGRVTITADAILPEATHV
jgi:hypothetical protein